MDWYDRLNDYFPEHEMKDAGQLRDLIREKQFYQKEETGDYILMYAEFDTFLFIDYLLVNAQTRGRGVGSQVLQRLKERGKLILLEVEPPQIEDEESLRRIDFYRKNGFQEASRIRYRRIDEKGEPYELKIFYWSPVPLSERVVSDNMRKACEEVHNFRSQKYYGRRVADPEEVLDFERT